MDEGSILKSLLGDYSQSVSTVMYMVNLLLTGGIAWLLGKVYIKYGHSHSSRVLFARNILMLAMTTMVVISIVKTSLAISIGLVGALSVVRFRAAIKEPEELIYLFLAIMVGLGMGANQVMMTVISIIVITIVIAVRGHRSLKKAPDYNLSVIINSSSPDDISLKTMANILAEYSQDVRLKRCDLQANLIEADFDINMFDIDDIELINKRLKHVDSDIKITFLEQTGLLI